MKLNERNIFLLDGGGAVLSAVSTAVILPLFYPWTGVPTSVSFPLALLGFAFAAYSFSCFALVKKTKPAMLMAIICANLFYCVLSMVIIFNLGGITPWGRAYFLIEALIVIGVVLVESMVYRRHFKSFT